jgi:hypothetical protein
MYPIKSGYHIYKGNDGKLRMDQIVNGNVYPLIPEDDDKQLALGYYDYDMKLVEAELIKDGNTNIK